MKRTTRPYTTAFKHFGEITIPVGTPVTSQTAVGIDPAYNFVNSFEWVKNAYPDFANILIDDMKSYGINVPPEYVSGYHSPLFLSSSLYKSGITTIKSESDRETVLDSLVQDFGFGSVHHLDDPASNLQPMITPEESALIDRLITECFDLDVDFDLYEYVNSKVALTSSK